MSQNNNKIILKYWEYLNPLAHSHKREKQERKRDLLFAAKSMGALLQQPQETPSRSVDLTNTASEQQMLPCHFVMKVYN